LIVALRSAQLTSSIASEPGVSFTTATRDHARTMLFTETGARRFTYSNGAPLGISATIAAALTRLP
jgi:hypothetical protein